jgi:hypothetical protein
VLLFTYQVRAQPAAPNVPPRINALYRQAGKAMAAGQFHDACPKLEQVVEHLPTALGARLELAECYEGLGNLEHAWQMCSETERLAAQQGNNDRKQEAQRCTARLDPNMPKVTVNVSDDVRVLPDLEITLDGARVEPSRWGAPITVVRGVHVVVASARGRLPLRKSITLQQGGTPQAIDVKSLQTATPTSSGSNAGGPSAGTSAGTSGMPSSSSQAGTAQQGIASASTGQQGVSPQGAAGRDASPESAAQQSAARRGATQQGKAQDTATQSAAPPVTGAPLTKRVNATDRDNEDGSRLRRRALGTIALGFGGAGAFVGTVLGTISLRIEDKGNALGTGSLVTLATSGVLLAAGGVLILTSGPNGSSANILLNPQGASAQLRW